MAACIISASVAVSSLFIGLAALILGGWFLDYFRGVYRRGSSLQRWVAEATPRWAVTIAGVPIILVGAVAFIDRPAPCASGGVALFVVLGLAVLAIALLIFGRLRVDKEFGTARVGPGESAMRRSRRNRVAILHFCLAIAALVVIIWSQWSAAS